MDEQLSRERAEAERRERSATGSSQDEESGQAGAKPDPQGTHSPQSEGKPAANAAEAGPPDQTGEGTGARAGEYS